MKTNTWIRLMTVGVGLIALVSTVMVSTPLEAAEPVAAVEAVNELSSEEISGLEYMREEEKLARDVYVTLYEQWNLPVFSNISGSEEQHMDAVKVLLDRYGIADPAAGKQPGEFSDATLQGLYDQLVAQGQQSQEDALLVGAAIEEIDIIDLQERIAQTTQADIVQVYQNLLWGSSNHLRAFTFNLSRVTGEDYQPQYLSEDNYREIIGDAAQPGGGPGRGRGRQR